MKNNAVYILVGTIFLSSLLSGYLMYDNSSKIAPLVSSLSQYRISTLNPSIKPATISKKSDARLPTKTPTPTESSSFTQTPQTNITVIQEEDNTEWGVAKEVDEGTYTIKIAYDAAMATPEEVLAALNAYRQTNGKSSLGMDQKLQAYAQSRADYFQQQGQSDKHAGFNRFLDEENGFETLGFMRLGENSYFGGPLTGTHVIEWVFAKSPGHNANQLDAGWSHAGVGVSSSSIDIIFGAQRF